MSHLTCRTTTPTFKNKPFGLSLMSQTCGRGTKCQQGLALVFSICHSWRHSLPNGNMLAVSVADDYQREVTEESLQHLQMLGNAIKGSRHAAN